MSTNSKMLTSFFKNLEDFPMIKEKVFRNSTSKFYYRMTKPKSFTLDEIMMIAKLTNKDEITIFKEIMNNISA